MTGTKLIWTIRGLFNHNRNLDRDGTRQNQGERTDSREVTPEDEERKKTEKKRWEDKLDKRNFESFAKWGNEN